MIESFRNRLAEDLFEDRSSKTVRKFTSTLRRSARRKLLYLHEATELRDLKAPPGNSLEALKEKWKSYYSIRINEQWRIVFQWQMGNIHKAQVIDSH